jgi:hypothetical protein
MSSVSQRTKYLVDHVMTSFIHDGCFHLPKAAPDFSQADERSKAKAIFPTLRIQIEESVRPNASISIPKGKITLTTAWCCQRWSSAYSLLTPDGNPQHPDLPLDEETFAWPAEFPDPENDAEPVKQINRIYPWIVTATVLHEVGHSLYSGVSECRASIELDCDRFAHRFLVGSREFDTKDLRMLGLACWVCCLCSESLGPGCYPTDHHCHAHPVDRVKLFLNEFVPQTTSLGNRIWLICIGHLTRLASFHRRPAFEEGELERDYPNWEEALNVLRLVW